VTIETSEGVFDPHQSFVQAAEQERPKVDIPDPVIDLLKAHVFANTRDGNIDPRAIPTDAAIGADVAHFESIWILELRKLIGPRSRRGLGAGGRRPHIERLMRPLDVEGMPKVVELDLL